MSRLHWDACKPEYLAAYPVTQDVLPIIEQYGKTAIDDKGPVFSIGLFPHREGIFDVWATVNAIGRIRRHSVTLIRDVTAFMHVYVKEYPIRRLQAFVNPYHDAGIKFAEFYGFEKEGLLRAYGDNGEDLLLFSRIFDDGDS